MTVKAVDKDSGDNGKVTYHLKVGNKNLQETDEFSIDRFTGELRSKIVLDRETKSKFEVRIKNLTNYILQIRLCNSTNIFQLKCLTILFIFY